MARRSQIIANKRKEKMSQKHFALRKQLREKVRNVNLPENERYQAQLKLQKMPRNSSSVRVRNRCELTGRPRAYYRAFGLSRIAFRELALQGMIPGVTKSSW